MTRKLVLFFVSVLGILILANLVVWFYAVFDALFNPAMRLPMENRFLGAGILSMPLQLGAIVEAIAVGIATRRRWIPRKRVWTIVLSMIAIVLMPILFFGIWVPIFVY